MFKLIVFLALAVSMVLVACSTGDGSEEVFEGDSAESKRGALEADSSFFSGAPAATAAPAASFAPQEAGDGRVFSTNLETAQRRVISTASVSIEGELV